MLKAAKKRNNYLNSNELVIKAMLKRRRLAGAAILNLCAEKRIIRVIK